MLLVSATTARRIESRASGSDERWSGAAVKYLAEFDGRTYLVKPDTGWPSDSARERVAAAYYRAMGQPTANVIRASVDGTPAVAVRVIEDAEPIGMEMELLNYTDALTVTRAALLACLIGDSDKHEFNFISDGVKVYAIDHGLAFNGSIGRALWTPLAHVSSFLSAGTIGWSDVDRIIEELPAGAYAMALLAYSHAGAHVSDDKVIDGDFREALRNAIADYRGPGFNRDSPDDEDCDCDDCRHEQDEPADPACWFGENHRHVLTDSGMRWRTVRPRGRPRIVFFCNCDMCERPARGNPWGVKGAPCLTGKRWRTRREDIQRGPFFHLA
jgi:hypothetical protein